MGWDFDSIKAKRAEIIAMRFKSSTREQLLDHLANVESSLCTMTFALSELDIQPAPRCSAWVSSPLFPVWDDNDQKILTINETEDPNVDFRDVPPTETWHSAQIESSKSLHIADGSKLADEFEIIAVHQEAPACYIGCGSITMGDVRRAAILLSAPKTDSKSDNG